MTTSPEIVIRDLRFNLDEVPKHWHGAGKSVSIFYDNLSVFFPVGERFFVTAVKAFRDQVTDPQLASEVQAFCTQEGHHSREHVAYNKMLERHGYPVRAMEARVDRILRTAMQRLPKNRHLLATCALEHFTAMLGALILRYQRLLEGAHPTMAALWKWHAAEEIEHKTVAWDVARAAKLPWALRSFVMLTATIIFWTKVFDHQVRMMWADGILFSPSEWWKLVKYLFLSPGGMLRLIPEWFRYYAPSFHPRQLDTEPLLEGWKSSFATSPEYSRALRS